MLFSYVSETEFTHDLLMRQEWTSVDKTVSPDSSYDIVAWRQAFIKFSLEECFIV